jgi:lipopolysaccharide export system protein LptC
MQISPRNLLGVALLVALAGFSWLWSRLETATSLTMPDAVSVPSGYYLIDATLLGTDTDGRVRYRLNAARAEEQADLERLTFSDVNIEYAEQPDTPWRVSADRGDGPTDLSYLDLSGNVVLSSTGTGQRDRWQISTDRLRFDPQQMVASSDDLVLLSLDSHTLSAVGMKVYMREDRLLLESEVHGRSLR